jgi:hypothetical protein
MQKEMKYEISLLRISILLDIWAQRYGFFGRYARKWRFFRHFLFRGRADGATV